MHLSAPQSPLLDLLEKKRSSNHYKVALRYFFMLEALGQPIPATHHSYCGAAMRRCPPRDLERIRRAARDWASFVNSKPLSATAEVDFERLVEDVLRILRQPRPRRDASPSLPNLRRTG